jgi:hypothetical protein
MAINFDLIEKDTKKRKPKTIKGRSAPPWEMINEKKEKSLVDNKLENINKPEKSLVQPNNRQIANRQQTDSKRVANRQQTDSKRVANKNKKKERGSRLDSKRIANRQQTDSKRIAKEIANKNPFQLVGNEQKFLYFIFNLCKKTASLETPNLSLEYIVSELNLNSKQLAKNIIHRVCKKKIVSKKASKTGRGGWSKFSLPDEIYNKLYSERDSKQIANGQQTDSKQIAKGIAKGIATPPSSSINNNINNILTTPLMTSGDGDTNIATNENQCHLEFTDHDWQSIDITPLQCIGFTHNHLSQIFTMGHLNARQVKNSIEAYAFDLKENKRAEKVKTTPLNLFMGILKKGQEYSPPKNYESEEDRVLREQVELERERLKKREEMQGELNDLKYQNWLLDLTIEKKLEILDVPHKFFDKMPVEAINEGLRKHFEMKVL